MSLLCVCSRVWFHCLQQRGSASVTKLSNELWQQPRVCVQHSGPDRQRHQHHCWHLSARTGWRPQGKNQFLPSVSRKPQTRIKWNFLMCMVLKWEQLLIIYNRIMECNDVLSQKLELRSNGSGSTIPLGFIALLKGVFTDLLSTTNVMQMHLQSTLHSWEALILECRCLI